MNRAMGRGDAKKGASVSSVVGLVGGYTVAVRKLPVDFGVKIGEGLTYRSIEFPDACLVWGHASSWLRGMVNKVICEELFEDFEPPFALNFFGVAPDNRLRFIRDRSFTHDFLSQRALHAYCRSTALNRLTVEQTKRFWLV